MTENPTDGVVTPDGQAGTPNPASSEGQPKPFEGDVSNLLTPLRGYIDERFTGLEESLKNGFGRVQGTVDRTGNDFRKWMGEVEKLEKSGLSREDAIEQLEQKQTANQWQTNMENQLKEIASIVRGGGNTNAQGQLLTEVMSEYKLDPKDPYVASMLQGKQFANRTEAEAWAGKVMRDKVLSNQPNQAQSASSPTSQGGSQRATSQQIEEKSTRLLRLFDNYDQNAQEISVLEKEIKEYWASQ